MKTNRNVLTRISVVAACTVMAFSMVACGTGNSKDNAQTQNNQIEDTTVTDDVNSDEVTNVDENEEENVQIANPWTQYDSIDEAVKNAGFPFEVPDEIGDYKIDYIQNLNTEMISVTYRASEDSETEILIRKGVGSDDISGDFNVYTDSNVVTVGDYEVAEKGNNGQVALATWTIDGYSYSVSVPDMAADDVAAIILQVK